jgi:hypothetical protein
MDLESHWYTVMAVERLSTHFGNIRFFDGCEISGESGHSLLIGKKVLLMYLYTIFVILLWHLFEMCELIL